MLAQKATGAQQALEEAKANLDKIKAGDGDKQEEHAALKKEKVKAAKALESKQAELEVSIASDRG